MKESIIVKGVVVAAVAGITIRALKVVKDYKNQAKEHEEVMEDSENDA